MVLCGRNPREPEVFQFVLPDLLRHRVLRLAQYHVLAGLSSQTRMFGWLRRTHYMPKMVADTLTTARECTAWAYNGFRLIKQAKLMRLIPATQPLDTVRIDRLGPLSKGKSTYRFILVITDRIMKLSQTVQLRKIRFFDVPTSFVN